MTTLYIRSVLCSRPRLPKGKYRRVRTTVRRRMGGYLQRRQPIASALAAAGCVSGRRSAAWSRLSWPQPRRYLGPCPSPPRSALRRESAQHVRAQHESAPFACKEQPCERDRVRRDAAVSGAADVTAPGVNEPSTGPPRGRRSAASPPPREHPGRRCWTTPLVWPRTSARALIATASARAADLEVWGRPNRDALELRRQDRRYRNHLRWGSAVGPKVSGRIDQAEEPVTPS